MHTYPNHSAIGTLLDNSSEGSSPQSSASNEDEVQELLHRASGNGLVGETKPIYNFSIPDMIRHRNSQESPGGSPGVRILSSQMEHLPQRRPSSRRYHRQAFPADEEDLTSPCQQRKHRRLSNRPDIASNTTYIDLTHSPDLPQGTSSNDQRYDNQIHSETLFRQSPVSSGTRRRSPMNHASRDHLRSTTIHSNLYPIPLDHYDGRSQRFTTLQHRTDVRPATPGRCLHHSHAHVNVDQHRPAVINIDDSPLNQHGYEGVQNPRMISNARYRREVVNDLRAQIRTQVEEVREAINQSTEFIHRVRTLRNRMPPLARPEEANAGNANTQDEVQFVGEFHPSQQPHDMRNENPTAAPYVNVRTARRPSDQARRAHTLAFFQSVLHRRRLPARQRFSDDYLLQVGPFDLTGAPPLHHIGGGVDGPVMNGDYEALWRLAERLGQAKPKGLSKQDIEKIPSFRFSSSCMAETNMTCVVCMSEYSTCEKLRRLSCNHDFHSKCIDKWLKSNKTCPVCRDEVKT